MKLSAIRFAIAFALIGSIPALGARHMHDAEIAGTGGVLAVYAPSATSITRDANETDQFTTSPVMLVRYVDLYSKLGDYETAISVANELLEWTEANLGPGDPEIAPRLLDLGWLYAEQGQLEKAETHYKRALYVLELLHGSNDVAIALPLSRLAGFYRAVRRYAEAELLYHRVLSLQVRSGHETPPAASTLRDLADLYRRQGNVDSAEPYYEYALAIFSNALGPDHPEVAFTEASYISLRREKQRIAQVDAGQDVIVSVPVRE